MADINPFYAIKSHDNVILKTMPEFLNLNPSTTGYQREVPPTVVRCRSAYRHFPESGTGPITLPIRASFPAGLFSDHPASRCDATTAIEAAQKESGALSIPSTQARPALSASPERADPHSRCYNHGLHRFGGSL